MNHWDYIAKADQMMRERHHSGEVDLENITQLQRDYEIDTFGPTCDDCGGIVPNENAPSRVYDMDICSCEEE